MVRPLLALIPERMRRVTLASSLAKNERPQSIRTLMPAGGRMAAPGNRPIERRRSRVSVGIGNGYGDGFCPGVISRPRMRRPMAPNSSGRSA